MYWLMLRCNIRFSLINIINNMRKLLAFDRDLYKQRDETLTEPKNKLTRCYAKGKRDLRPNETSRFEANFHSRHFDKARPWQSNREIIRVQINQVLPTQKYSLQRFVEFDTSYCFICFRLCFVFTYKTTVGIFTKSCVSLFTLP